MAKTPTEGRPSLFRGKTERYRVQGVLSDEGGRIFEAVRDRMIRSTQRKSISDADVIEAAVRHYAEARV